MRQSVFPILTCIAVLLSASAAQASVVISTDATQNMSCSAGVCTPTDKKAVLNVNDLTNMLAAGDVKVTTGAGAQTITIAAPFSWTSTSHLTLDAYYNVSFRAPVTVAGTGAVTITYNDGGSDGDLIFFPGAKLDFWDASSSLIVNGNSYTLAGDIKSLADQVRANPSGFFAFAADYDSASDGTYASSPVRKLSGTFEGLGHAIDHFRLKSPEHDAGLFATINERAVVRDIALSNAALDARKHVIAAVAGLNLGVVEHCSATGRISGENGSGLVGRNEGTIADGHATVTIAVHLSAGGLAGTNTGTIRSSSASVSVQGFGQAGGLVAYNEGGLIEDSKTDGSVLAPSGGYAGGLVALNFGGSILDSSSSASVSSNNLGGEAGGLVGSSGDGGEIAQSFATGAVSGQGLRVGGLVGESSGTSITESYSTGMVSGDGTVNDGGLAGYTDAVIDQAYAIGKVSGGDHVGGFLGAEQSPAMVTSGYWDLDTTGQDIGCGVGSCAGVTGLHDSRLRAKLPHGFDPAVWGQSASVNNGYPYLLANPPPQ